MAGLSAAATLTDLTNGRARAYNECMTLQKAIDVQIGALVRTTATTGSRVQSVFTTPDPKGGRNDRVNLILTNGVTILNLRPTTPVSIGEAV